VIAQQADRASHRERFHVKPAAGSALLELLPAKHAKPLNDGINEADDASDCPLAVSVERMPIDPRDEIVVYGKGEE
jgi:hypothetical protein